MQITYFLDNFLCDNSFLRSVVEISSFLSSRIFLLKVALTPFVKSNLSKGSLIVENSISGLLPFYNFFCSLAMVSLDLARCRYTALFYSVTGLTSTFIVFSLILISACFISWIMSSLVFFYFYFSILPETIFEIRFFFFSCFTFMNFPS